MGEMFPVYLIGAVILYMLYNAYRQGGKTSLFKTTRSVVVAVVAAILVRSIFFSPFNIPSESMVSTLQIGDHLFATKYSYGVSGYSFPYGMRPYKGVINDKPVIAGDIVIFKEPNDLYTDLIKRVVGIPGDKIQMVNKDLYINDKKIKKEFVGQHLWIKIPSDMEGVPFGIKGEEKFVKVMGRKAFVDGKEFPASVAYVSKYACGNGSCGAFMLDQYKETLGEKSYYILQSKYPTRLDNFGPVKLKDRQYFMMGDNRDFSGDSRVFGAISKNLIIAKAGPIFLSHNNRMNFFVSLLTPWNWGKQFRIDRFFLNSNVV